MRVRSFLVALLIIPAVQAQTVHFVTSPFDSGGGTLRQVIGDALDGDTIRFQITGTIALTSANITYDKDLVIEGPGPDQLIISGNMLNVPFVVTGGSTRISGLTIQSGRNQYGSISTAGGFGFAGDTLIMTDVHFVDCSQTGIGGYLRFGGGLRASGAHIRVSDCLFTGNTVMMDPGDSGQGFGGGAAIFGEDFEVRDCQFLNNTVRGRSGQFVAYGMGGGLYVQGTGRIDGCTMEGNSAQGLTVQSSYPPQDAYAQGGGLAIDTQSSVEVVGCTISNNALTCGAEDDRNWQGGGVYIEFANVSMRNCTILENTGTLGGTSGDRNQGGGVYIRDGILEMMDCEVNGNVAKDGSGIFHIDGFSNNDRQVLDLRRTRIVGGSGTVGSGAVHSTTATAIYMQDVEVSDNTQRGLYFTFGDSLLVDRCLFEHNRGGVWLASMTTNENVMLNSTFHRNGADQGGAIHASNNTTMQLVNCTFVDDSLTAAGTSGRELYLVNSTTLLRNCVFAETFPHGATAFGGTNPVALSTGGNVCDDASLNAVLISGSDATEVDPGLGTFADHGGFTRTWSLASGSTCIDRGGADTLSVDQRGFVRDASSDAGAYEGGATDPLITLTSGPEDATFCVGQALLLEVVASSALTLEYQWQLDGEDIDGATDATYGNTVALTDAGAYSCLISNGFSTVSSDVAVVLVEVCTGLRTAYENAFTAYPVPFTENVTIRWSGALQAIVLRDAMGRVLRNDPVAGIDHLLLSTGSLPPAVYLIESIDAAGRVAVQRVVKVGQ